MRSLCVVLFLASSVLAADNVSLHQQIDQRIDAARIGQETPLCTDAEFVRRATLRLTGVIPTSAEARDFLNDASPNKREVLIDRLLADPRFARWMQISFDVMLMERLAAKAVPQAEWTEYLYQSFASNKPLDQLVREILAADSDDELRPAARFYLDRSGEKFLVTRDVARVFLGRDIQCSQCHDHPTIGDYAQEDYYGLFSFFNRSYVVTDPKTKKASFAEKAEGDLVDFKSVFTDEAGKAGPHLPGAPILVEPVLAKGDEYKVKPAKDVRSVPKYSRRSQLANELTSGKYRPFPRNMANRLWGLVFGRGIVHPYDLHHSDNPPVHGELLELLADELVARKFDTRSFVRELVLTKAWQRSSVMPALTDTQLASLQEQRARLDTAQDAADTEMPAGLTERLNKLRTDLADAVAKVIAAEKPLAEIEKKVAAADKALTAARQQATQAADLLATFEPLATQAKTVAAALPAEAVVTDASSKLSARAAKLKADLDAKNKTLGEKQAAHKVVADQLAAARGQVNLANEARAAAQRAQHVAETELAEIESRQEIVQRKNADVEVALADVDALIAWREAVQQQQPEQPQPANMEEAWDTVVQRWSNRFFVAGVEPLKPEQMALSVMQATGVYDAIRAGVENAELAKLKKENKEAAPGELKRLSEKPLFAKLQGSVNAFVGVMSQGSGPAATEYQTTVQEALFVANGANVAGWVRPSGNNLTARLLKAETPQTLADELYLSVLTRQPDAEEISSVEQFLAERKDDRQLAVEEMVWGLLSSGEFRFHH